MGLTDNYKFTNKKHAELGIMSTILGGISLFYLLLIVVLTIVTEKPVSAGYGLTCVLAFIMAICGEVFGIITKRKKDAYGLFPIIGIIINGVSIAVCLFFVLMGIR